MNYLPREKTLTASLPYNLTAKRLNLSEIRIYAIVVYICHKPWLGVDFVKELEEKVFHVRTKQN